MRSTLWATVIATVLLVPAPGIFAQAFPVKMVRIVIPFAVGGSSDASARIVGPALSERWKQQVLIEPRPGAGTVVGADYVAKSPPDGYILLVTTSQVVQTPATFAKLPYDPYTDLMPVTLIAVSPQAIIAHPSLPVKNMKDLIALARARPGELNIGTAGTILPTHRINMLANIKLTIVPYKGAGPMLIDTMGGHVPLASGAVSSIQGAVRNGRLRILGVTSPTAAFPDAPLIARDVPGYDYESWTGMFAPGGTSRNLVMRIRDDVVAVLQHPDVRQRLLHIGMEPRGQTPEEFTARVRTEIAVWKKVAAAAGITPQ
jgi:tripartite-type tricarboxylate transporter receptor subunit TctC